MEDLFKLLILNLFSLFKHVGRCLARALLREKAKKYTNEL